MLPGSMEKIKFPLYKEAGNGEYHHLTDLCNVTDQIVPVGVLIQFPHIDVEHCSDRNKLEIIENIDKRYKKN